MTSKEETIRLVIEQANILLERAVAHPDTDQRERFIIAAGFLMGNLEWCGHITEAECRDLSREWGRRYAMRRDIQLPDMNVVNLQTYAAMKPSGSVDRGSVSAGAGDVWYLQG
jgi:hypothetical protein